MNTSQMPFSCFTVADLTRIGNESADTRSNFLLVVPGSDDTISKEQLLRRAP